MSGSPTITSNALNSNTVNKCMFLSTPWTLINKEAPCSPLLKGLITLASIIVTLGISIIFMIAKAICVDTDMSRRHVAQTAKEENDDQRNRLADSTTTGSGHVVEAADVNPAATDVVAVAENGTKDPVVESAEDESKAKPPSKTQQKKQARIAKRKAAKKAGQEERAAARQAAEDEREAQKMAFLAQIAKNHIVHTVNGTTFEIDGNEFFDANNAMFSAIAMKTDPEWKNAQTIKLIGTTPQSVKAFGTLISQLNKDKNLGTKKMIVHIPALCVNNFNLPDIHSTVVGLNHPHLVQFGSRVTFTTDPKKEEEKDTPLERAVDELNDFQSRLMSRESLNSRKPLFPAKAVSATVETAFVPKEQYTAAELLTPGNDLLNKLAAENQKMAASGGINFSITIENNKDLEPLAEALTKAFETGLPKEIKIILINQAAEDIEKNKAIIKLAFFRIRRCLSFRSRGASKQTPALLEELNNYKMAMHTVDKGYLILQADPSSITNNTQVMNLIRQELKFTDIHGIQFQIRSRAELEAAKDILETLNYCSSRPGLSNVVLSCQIPGESRDEIIRSCQDAFGGIDPKHVQVFAS